MSTEEREAPKFRDKKKDREFEEEGGNPEEEKKNDDEDDEDDEEAILRKKLRKARELSRQREQQVDKSMAKKLIHQPRQAAGE